MFKKYGIIGLILIVFVEINFFLKIEPFARWYFPIVWVGYILLVDAIIYHISKESYLMNKKKQIFLMLILSALIWWMFEYINFRLGNWDYINIKLFISDFEKLLFGWISFSTVIPAVFETVHLLTTVHLFDALKLKNKHMITKRLLYGMICAGVISFILIMAFPKYLFPSIWVSFYLILDPINCLHKQPSIIKHLKDRKLSIPIALFVGGILCGLLWEFWNFWALPKWIYTFPWGGPKIFEMPILGYLGYAPFAWELYAMYYFVRNLLMKKKEEII
ncbi:MAG: hypothetical protein ABH824_07730 [Nanoarchaeota archaeon]|nr:hypothetical protein [Nanoarchaeota archaeon]MBU1631629.1 hypothetical protein [Nanoarchaeota archaeon]MBU1876618.1 hypothetical protein [Nanoarchaeota archaeon]